MTDNGKKTRAMTLTELLVVMAVMVILLAIATPVAKKLSQSLGNSAGAYSIIDAALTSARSIAVREGHYAGVRFQQDSNGKQYLVFIINDPAATSFVNGFRAVEGRKPVALPDDVGVMGAGTYSDTTTAGAIALDTTAGMTNATTFSVIFNSSGKFVVHLVRVSNAGVNDKIFNTQTNVSNGIAMFVQDTIDEDGVSSFLIYSKKGLDKVAVNKRWSGYLSGLNKDYVNPYTGELVRKN
jgi:prepilin-type N-terminal cleavage/methylation domain-containing protein